METNWLELGLKLGSLREDGSESGGDDLTRIALEDILGEEWIHSTVRAIVEFRRGTDLAMGCLRYIRSWKAASYAYEIYKTSSRDEASLAVWLIKHIAHPASYEWVREFLEDENVAAWGIGLLDQLLWRDEVRYDENVEQLLQFAVIRSNGALAENVQFIREYLERRAKEA